VVFKARHLRLNRTVALKMVRAGQLAGPLELQRFRAEVEAAARLQHPNIVTLYEIGEEGGLPYFSMEYVEGQTLAQVLERGTLSAKRAAGYLRTIAEAIHYAHQQGVLHRDLKPSNVLIDLFDKPRITDFGLAKRLASSPNSEPGTQLTLTGQVLGTPGFMPPEQAAASPRAMGRQSDVYSLGALLYFMLTGRAPFSGCTLMETLSSVVNSPPVSPRLLNAAVPRDLETICLKCLEKEPLCRYTTALELADDLERFLKNEPIRARPVGPLARFWRLCRRYPASASLAASLLLTVSALAITVALMNKKKTSPVFAPSNVHVITDVVASRATHHYSGLLPTVVAVDGTTLSQTEIGVGGGVAVDLTNNAYWSATLYQEGVVVRSGKTDLEVTRFSLGDCPGGVSLDSARRLAWVTAQCGKGNDLLWAIDADTYSIIGGPLFCGGVNGGPEVVNPATGRFYHNCNPGDPRHGACQRIDPRTFILTKPSFGVVRGVHPTANLLYAAGSGNLLQILDGGPDPEIVLTNVSLPFPAERTCIAVNPISNRLYVGSLSSARIAVFDARTGQSLETIALEGGVKVAGVRGIDIDAKRNRLFVVADIDQRCYLFAIQGAAQRAVELPGLAGGPVFNPAINRIYVWGTFQSK
jgi:serine/threonine protein kinase